MNNAEIVLRRSVELMESGFLRGTHNYFHFKKTPEEVVYIQIPEPIMNKAEAEKKGFKLKTDAVKYSQLLIPIWIPVKDGMILKNTQYYTMDMFERVFP